MDTQHTDPTDDIDETVIPTPPPAAAGWTPAGPTSDQRNWGLLAHLSAFVAVWFGGFALLGPLAVWVYKKDSDPFVGEHARQALNFNIGAAIVSAVGGVVAVVLAVLTIGLGLIVIVPVALGVVIAWGVLVIKAALAASRGEMYEYPFSYEFIR